MASSVSTFENRSHSAYLCSFRFVVFTRMVQFLWFSRKLHTPDTRTFKYSVTITVPITAQLKILCTTHPPSSVHHCKPSASSRKACLHAPHLCAMTSNQADAAVAIPWFNNIWFGSTSPSGTPRSPDHSDSAVESTSATVSSPPPPGPSEQADVPADSVPVTENNQEQAPSLNQQSTSTMSGARTCSIASSRQTISTLSALDRISLISLLSTRHASASDILRSLSDPDLMSFANSVPTPTFAPTSIVRRHFHATQFRSAPHIYADSLVTLPSSSLPPNEQSGDDCRAHTQCDTSSLVQCPISMAVSTASTMRRTVSTPPRPTLYSAKSIPPPSMCNDSTPLTHRF